MLKPCVIHVRVTDEEFAVLTLVAKQRGIPVSRPVRERLFNLSRRARQSARSAHYRPLGARNGGYTAHPWSAQAPVPAP